MGAINPITTAVFYTGNTAEDFREKTLKYQISWKSAQWEPCYWSGGWRDRQTDMSKLIIAFENCAKALENEEPKIYDLVP
jgi:hypothetical protein